MIIMMIIIVVMMIKIYNKVVPCWLANLELMWVELLISPVLWGFFSGFSSFPPFYNQHLDLTKLHVLRGQIWVVWRQSVAPLGADCMGIFSTGWTFRQVDRAECLSQASYKILVKRSLRLHEENFSLGCRAQTSGLKISARAENS